MQIITIFAECYAQHNSNAKHTVFRYNKPHLGGLPTWSAKL